MMPSPSGCSDRVAMHGEDAVYSTLVYAVAAEALAVRSDLVACQRALDRAEQVHRLIVR